MANRKINTAMIHSDLEDTLLQAKEKVSHAKSIDDATFPEFNFDEIINSCIQPRLHTDEPEFDDLSLSIALIRELHTIDAAVKPMNSKNEHSQAKEEVSRAKSIDGETFSELSIEDIKNNPMQPRLNVDEAELKNLARSIKLCGLIQPISVIKIGDNEYILKAGQRRLLAHKELGLKTIKAIVQEETILSEKERDKALFEIAIIENIQRDKLNPLELALSLRNAMDKNIYKNLEELGIALGKSKSYLSKVFKVLSLDDEIIRHLEGNKSTNDIESLYEIQKIKDKKEQVRIYFDLLAKRIDRKGLRDLNKKKVAHAKQSYHFSKMAKIMKLEFDTSKLTNEEINGMNKELEEILKKYLD